MESRTIRDLVAAHPLLADLPAADLDLIAGCGRNVHHRAGDLLMREGEPADTFFLVRSGRVASHCPRPAGTGSPAGRNWSNGKMEDVFQP